MAKAYTYDSTTKKYLAVIDVATGKEGEYILPPNSTMVAPPPTVTAGKELYWEDRPARDGEAASSAWAERDVSVVEVVVEDPTVVIDGMDRIPEFKLRARIQECLERTDWTQLADYSGTAEQQAAWRAYRTALRALPDTDGWPSNPVWPTPPEQLPGVRFEQAERQFLAGTYTDWSSIDTDASILPNSWTKN